MKKYILIAAIVGLCACKPTLEIDVVSTVEANLSQESACELSGGNWQVWVADTLDGAFYGGACSCPDEACETNFLSFEGWKQ